MEVKNKKRKNYVTTTVWWAATIFFGAIISAAGLGAYSAFSLGRSVPFRVSAVEGDISSLKEISRKDSENASVIKTDIAVIKNDIETLKDSQREILSILRAWEVDK